MEASEERLKKRKRASNAPDSKSRPSKKLAQTPSEAEISFRFIDEKHEWAPVLGMTDQLSIDQNPTDYISNLFWPHPPRIAELQPLYQNPSNTEHALYRKNNCHFRFGASSSLFRAPED